MKQDFLRFIIVCYVHRLVTSNIASGRFHERQVSHRPVLPFLKLPVSRLLREQSLLVRVALDIVHRQSRLLQSLPVRNIQHLLRVQYHHIAREDILSIVHF